MNTLCDTALLIAFADEKPTVTADDIMAAVEELDWKEFESDTGQFTRLDNLAVRHANAQHVTQIEIRSEGESISVQSFGPGRVIIGRSPDNEVCIKSKFVSRHHAQLISDADGCTIEDLNSTNGVFIAERQVKKQKLKSGDVVALGAHDLIYTDLRESDDYEDDEDE